MKSLSRFFYLGSTIIFCSLFAAPVMLSMEIKKQSQSNHKKQPYFVELITSIKNNDCNTLKRLITENKDLTSTTYTYAKDAQISVTCLGLVMCFNKIAPIPMMQILLDNGADINQGQETNPVSKDPVSALVFADMSKNQECYDFLRKKSNRRVVRIPKQHKRQ